MDLFSIIKLIGGLAFFLYGMHTMSSGLERMTNGKLERMLQKATSNPIISMALGCLITIAVQSSSALTVMLVGLVNSGVMHFEQTFFVLLGSNIGTTLTAWIFSLAGIQSSSIFTRMLKPESFAPVLAIIGVIMIMSQKTRGRKKDVGATLVGFAILMSGMSLMSDAMSPLAQIKGFENVTALFAIPIVAVLIGTVFTGVIQSSAAAIGILQALSISGVITWKMAIPLVMGINIGTCATAIISAIGTNKNAKRVAVLHTSLKIYGTLICLVAYYAARLAFSFDFLNAPVKVFDVALIHSIFNIANAVILLPMRKPMTGLSKLIIKDGPSEISAHPVVMLDERLFTMPAVALEESRKACQEMAALSIASLSGAFSLIDRYDEKTAEAVIENEDAIDIFEDHIGTYLVKLSGVHSTRSVSEEISQMLLTIGDFERIGDHAQNIQELALSMNKKQLRFSDAAMADLNVLFNATNEILRIAVQCFDERNEAIAARVEPLEQLIDELGEQVKHRHYTRLRQGKCTLEIGIDYMDLLTNIERISDHCSNIAVCVIQIKNSSFDTHSYLNAVKAEHDAAFSADYQKFSETYVLPPEE